MNKINLTIILILFSFGKHFSQTTTNCDPALKYPGGRMALSFDGNVHDDDDIIALPVSMGMIWAAGLKDKVAHLEYNNHVCSHGTETDGSANFQGDDAVNMQESTNGSIKRFGFDGAKFFDFSTKGTEATANFISAINASSATDPLWIIAAGPMETVWRALNGAQTTKRQFVTIISHSRWNQNHGDCGTNSHTWTDLVEDFTGNGVKFVESCGYRSDTPCTNQQLSSSNFLPDQNITNGDNDFSTPINKWHWLRDSNDINLSWIFTRNPFGTKFDPSDAGIVYFLITGGPNNGGAKKAGWKEVKTLFENPCKNNSGGSPSVPSDITNLTLTSSSCTSVTLAWGDVTGEEGYKIRRKTSTTNYIVLADLPANTTSYTDATALENTTYQYMVRPTKGGLSVAVSNSPLISTKVCSGVTEPTFKAYPNPTTGIITLPEVYANDQINVVSVTTGTTILTKKITQNGSIALDITNQPAGNYIIQINRNSQQLTRQIIKQ